MDLVLIHGFGQSGEGWRPVVDRLEQRGHRVFAPDLPADQPDWGAKDYADFVAGQVDVTDPVLVGHSGTGTMMAALSTALDARHLVWFAAVVPDFAGGSTFRELAETRQLHTEEALTWDDPLGDITPVTAYFLFHDCDLAQLRFGLSTLRVYQPLGVLDERPVAQQLPPSTYILPKDDRILSPAAMRRMARDRLGVEPVEIDGGHCAQIAYPDRLTELITRV